MTVVQCNKCGNMIPISRSETQRILYKIHSLEDKLSGCRTRERLALVQKISTLRTQYRQTVHTLNELDRITAETPVLYADLRQYVLEHGLMGEAELDAPTAHSKAKVEEKRLRCETEISRLTADFRKGDRMP